MEDSSNCDTPCDGETVGTILNQMATMPKCDLQPLNIDSFSCSDCDVCDVRSVVSMNSMKEGCGSPMSSWASDPETDISSVTSCHVFLQDVDLEGNYPDLQEENQFAELENNDDGFSWEMDNRSYEELLKKFIEKEEKFIEKEEELRVSNFKLQLSEQEIVRLRVHVENSESQIIDMHEKLELKEDELYEQKGLSDKEISKLKIQIKESESQLDAVRGVHKELDVKNSQLSMIHQILELDLKNVHQELNLRNDHLQKVHKELQLKKYQLDNVREELKLKAKEMNEQKELSKEEIFKLKAQMKESENQLESVRKELELKADQFDNVRQELKLKVEELNKQKMLSKEEVSELKTQIKGNESHITDLMKTLNVSKKELDSKSSMIHQLQCQIKKEKENTAALEYNIETLVTVNDDNDSNHKEELRKLNLTLQDSQVMFSWEREKMDADIARLSELRYQLTSKLEEFGTRNKELEKKVTRHEAEKSHQNKLHSAQVKLLQDEISCLKKELGQRMNDVEASNKESKKAMIEINEANVKVDKLKAEICSRGDQISHMKKHIDELNTSLKELVVHYRTKVNEENKLIMRVEELEKEVSKQNVVMLEKAEESAVEKNAAVKQLWNSLEYNWSGCSDLFKR